MSHTDTAHLRLFADSWTAPLAPGVGVADSFERLCEAYAVATGLRLQIASSFEADEADVLWSMPLQAGERLQGRLKLRSTAAADDVAASPVPLDEACGLAAAIGDAYNDLLRTRLSLKQREAELAAGVPLSDSPGSERHFAERLESVLKSAAESIGCSSAAVYMLDAGTTELKLRAHWGLTDLEFLRSPRALRTAMADLEALAGHAVALEDAGPFTHWNLPEVPFQAAVCVPIASHSELLGTLWVFAPAARPFSDHEVNLVEVCAGRLASDFEREMLLVETRDASRMRQHWDDFRSCRDARLPKVAPLVDGWDIAGWSGPDDAVVEFYDWVVDDDGALNAALGQVDRSHFAAAIEMEAARSAWRAHARRGGDFAKLLGRLGDDLWSGTSEPAASHLAAVRCTGEGRVQWSGAGRASGLILPAGPGDASQSDRQPMTFERGGPPLGMGGEIEYDTQAGQCLAGDLLVLTNSDAQLANILHAWRSDAKARTKLRNAKSVVKWILACDREPGGQGEMPALLVIRRTS